MGKSSPRNRAGGTLKEAVAALEAAVRHGEPTEELGEHVQALQDAIPGASVATINEALRRLARLALAADLEPAAAAVYGSGLLVKAGGDVRLAVGAVVNRCQEAMALAATYQRALMAAWNQAEAASGKGLSKKESQKIAAQVAAALPAEASVGDLLASFCAPLLVIAERSKEARQRLRQNKAFVRDIGEFCHFRGQPEGRLAQLLQVPDDEVFVVLYPEARRGYRVRISGISNNFQLHTLLADALIGDPAQGWLPGNRPDPRVVDAARDGPYDESTPTAVGSFHLMDWTALRPDGTVTASPNDHVIWHEGTPADIPRFGDTRVVVLGPPLFERTWRAPRDYPELAGELEVVENLPKTAVDAWLRRLGNAARA
jgi:hypothetical protein